MEKSLPKPGEKKQLSTKAEQLRKNFARFVETNKDHFKKQPGKDLPELEHRNTMAEAEALLMELGVNDSV